MKLLKIFAAALFVTTSAFAQSTTTSTTTTTQATENIQERGIGFGIKGGVNFATLTGNDVGEHNSRTNFHAGVFVEFPMAEIFSLQVEGLYSGEGYKSDVTGPDGDKAELQLDYINLPILAKFYITKGLSVEAGPQFSFLVVDEYDSNPFSNSGDIDLSNTSFDANGFEFGAAGGITFETEIGLFASGRYNYGFTKVYDNLDIHNSVFQISLGYKF